MLEPDWVQERPGTAAASIEALWKRVGIGRRTAPPEADQLLQALRKTHSNGGAEFEVFDVAGGPDFDWFMSRNRWDEIELPERFLRSRPVAAALPKVCREPVGGSFGFQWGSAFTLAGELAQALALGGAYEKHEGGSGDAYAIADRFRAALFGDRFEEVLVLRSHQPWSAWFCGIAWDATWLIVDRRLSTVGVFALTDTD